MESVNRMRCSDPCVRVGLVRPSLADATDAELVGRSNRLGCDQADALVIIVGAVDATQDGDPARALSESAGRVGDAVSSVFLQIQDAVRGATGQRLYVVLVVDSEAALGAPERVADSTAAAALISLARSLAPELKDRGFPVHVVFTNTVARDDSTDRPPGLPDAFVARRVTALVDEGIESTGQEIFLGDSPQLERMRP